MNNIYLRTLYFLKSSTSVKRFLRFTVFFPSFFFRRERGLLCFLRQKVRLVPLATLQELIFLHLFGFEIDFPLQRLFFLVTPPFCFDSNTNGFRTKGCPLNSLFFSSLLINVEVFDDFVLDGFRVDIYNVFGKKHFICVH